MLKISGTVSTTLSRHSLWSLERRLLIPHHGIVFQRASSQSPQLANTRLDRRRSGLPKRSTGPVRQSKPEEGMPPEVPEERQARGLKKRKRETQESTQQSTRGRQTRSESSGDRETRKAEGLPVPSRLVHGEIYGSRKLAKDGLDAHVPIRQVDPYREPGPLKPPLVGHVRNPQFPRPHEPHFYVDTAPPSDHELLAARPFFIQAVPKFAFSCSKFVEFPKSDVPEFAFIGRSNVGKSSLLNALFYAHTYNKRYEKELAKVGTRAGLTKLMNVFLAGDIDGGTEIKKDNGKKEKERWIRTGRGIAIVDMPGYGYGSHDFQGKEIIKYLSRRTQLRRTFVLVNSKHGVTDLDEEMFKILAQAGISYQIVLTKADECMSPGANPATITQIRYGLELLQRTKSQLDELVKPPLRDVLCVSAKKSLIYDEGRDKHDLIGMNALRFAMLQAASIGQGEIPQPQLPTARADSRNRRGKHLEKHVLRESIRQMRLNLIKSRMKDLRMKQKPGTAPGG